VPVTVAICIAV